MGAAEPDPGADNSQGYGCDSMLEAGGRWVKEPVDPVKLIVQSEASQLGTEMLVATTTKLFNSLIASVRPIKTLLGGQHLPKRQSNVGCTSRHPEGLMALIRHAFLCSRAYSAHCFRCPWVILSPGPPLSLE
jgi:hypothetical protein